MSKFVKPISIFFALLLIILGGVLLSKQIFSPIQSASTDNVSGYAWSETIGWVSFNCTDRGVCGSSNYGVNIDIYSGDFSGYAWSENIGWIDFSPSGPYPETLNYSASYDMDTGKVTGWVRAISYGGGWDGWILLGDETGSWSNQVTIDSGAGIFTGWAWGDTVVGWISFNCADRGVCGSSDYKVITSLNFPPEVSCDDNETWVYCSDSRNPFLSWDYSDEEDDPQESYWLQIDDNSGFGSPEIDTGEVFTSSTTYHPTGTALDWDTTYYWRVKVKDDQGSWSQWSECSFDTIEHAYPSPNFNWTPQNPSALEMVQFADDSSCYDDDINGSECTEPNDTFKWTIEKTTEGDPVVKWGEQVQATFSEPGSWDATLEVTDSDGFMCPITRVVNVSYPLPEWKEIIPR